MTKLYIKKCLFLLFAFSALIFNASLRAQGTAFTYQGRLNTNNGPAAGNYDLTFTLFTTNTDGTAIAGPITNTATAISNGLFIQTLDFGSQFPGASRWLEIGVRTNGNGVFTRLTPRQSTLPTPYAIYAGTAGAVAATNLTGIIKTAQLPTGVPVNDRVSLGYTEPNGYGFQSSASFWSNCGMFVFRGIASGGVPTAAYAILYTTSLSTWYRVRLYDVSNNTVVAESNPNNTGTLTIPEAVNLGPLVNLPATPVVFAVQILATDATGQAYVSGRQNVGIFDFQLF